MSRTISIRRDGMTSASKNDKRVQMIRQILMNDGRSWVEPIRMLEEIEDIVRQDDFTFTCSVDETVLLNASVKPEIEAEVRLKMAKRLEDALTEALGRART
jgi:hypothetical protein